MKAILYIHFHKNLSKKCKIMQIVQKTLLIHVHEEVILNKNAITILLVNLSNKVKTSFSEHPYPMGSYAISRCYLHKYSQTFYFGTQAQNLIFSSHRDRHM